MLMRIDCFIKDIMIKTKYSISEKNISTDIKSETHHNCDHESFQQEVQKAGESLLSTVGELLFHTKLPYD